jgi:glycosyltransferase involved in cell wall biosynthesis
VAVSISVIIPSYNSGRFLREAINSALGQSEPPLEVLVQDAGSTDETLEVLHGYADRVSWISEPDGGQSDALNRMLRRARGNVIAWLNADDVCMPGAFAAAVATLEVHPESEFVFGDFDLIDGRGRILRRYTSSDYSFQRLLRHGTYIFSGAMFIRRRLFDRIGEYDASLYACMDIDLLLRAGDESKPTHFVGSAAQLRMHGNNKSTRAYGAFFREGHRIRQRYVTGMADYRWMIWRDAQEAVFLLSTPLRLSRVWSFFRRGKRLK